MKYLSVMLLWCAASGLIAAESSSWGPAHGSTVDVQAHDQTGKVQTVATLTGEKGLLLFFNRSADWWPFCQRQLVQLESERQTFEAIGVKVAGMTYDSTEALAAFHGRMQLGYPLLHDERARHVSALGILNEDYAPGDSAYGIPHPGILFISPEGKVLARFAVPGYRQRPPLDEVLAVVKQRIAEWKSGCGTMRSRKKAA
jgi:peroxiredoxin